MKYKFVKWHSNTNNVKSIPDYDSSRDSIKVRIYLVYFLSFGNYIYIYIEL